MTMRAEGMLSCRSLSFSGAAFRLVPVALEGAARGVYEAACALWQRALLVAKRLGKAKKLEVKRMKQKNNSEVKDLSFYMRSFWACQQQFFRQLLICAKVDEATKLAEAALLRGEAVVISMWSTGESVTQARLRREGPDAAEAFASAPREIALRMSEKILAPMVEHIRCDRERSQFEVELIGLGTALKDMPLPANPLDDLLARLGGPGKVAELTGRSRRLVRRAGGMHWEDRGDGANLAEQEAFQSGRKLVAIITEAASAGISLHCDRRLPTAGQRPRYICA
ncbi:unnamed protein product [Prorocentrum cordatum]|uniref:Strawberry notch helicase C domain-containing protein n=1 Tax=Prorocentrum cordatum TaxID=2364126 RepID=A0ABN9PLG6_9DINO|nr:unnamed protein product [Polarella glacialis]